MPGTLGLLDLGHVEGSAQASVSSRLLAGTRPLLAVGRISSPAILLGRYQRAETVLTEQAVQQGYRRRVTGGRVIAVSEGQIAVWLVVPHRSWLVDVRADAIPVAKFMNRAVRGILSGLQQLGVGAYYFGRDFVTVESAQAGYLTFDIAGNGASILECVLAAETHWWLPDTLNALPQRPPERGVPGPGRIQALESRTSAEVLDALGRAYAERFGLSTRVDDAALPEPAEVPEPASLPRRSSLHTVPIGFVEARTEITDGRISAATFNGDFLADSAGVAAAERAVVGATPTLAEIAPRLNSVYANQPAHIVTGVTDLGVWATSLIEAASS